ncbi:PQQ-dependent sugar dehydrogenase [Segetibacter sp. 3557_3]|uniref:PQQ-dependent sugar dehydrogenase n=1 Tax=Segetibacter sp. 3557_3 TaxID=2547429 RepID=UPI001058A060|nr:PQQ-dependent sugar dehydrogenase [Segetibacter sp. 3557_3]TDH27240.1 PQQ-dependent sugar dehydrogenase [Segetibacter sp. 3557_3]
MLRSIRLLALLLTVLVALFGFIKLDHPPVVEDAGFPDGADTSFAEAAKNYQGFCGGCHGEKMNAFVDRNWKHGNSRNDLYKAIKSGYHDEGMPAFDSAFTDQQIYALSDYILTGIKNVSRYTGSDRPKTNTFKTENLTIRLDTVVKGLNIPWGMAFLPGGEMLVNDKGGKIYHVKKDGSMMPVTGGPSVVAAGQGGLLDVITDPGYTTNKIVYFSYSKAKQEDGRGLATTAIMRAKFENGKLTEQQDIFVAEPWSTTRHHYGSRMQFGKDGYLYFSVGERGNERQNPQEIKGNDLGKVHRIKPDGTIPADNPFVKTAGAEPSIYSYGHRNPQGMTIHPQSGQIWTNEHGPRGGDEINIVRPAKNYGWPEITYGINYNGKPMGPDTKTAREGMEQPLHEWTPSIGPSGLAFVTGNKYKGWTGNLISGSLRFQYLNRSVIQGNKVVKEEILFKNIGRVRDVRMGPDGFIYMSVENPGIIYRLTPVNGG